MTEEELQGFLQNNKDAIFEASRNAIIDKIKDSVRWELPPILSEQTSAFFKEEIAPEITKLLHAQKGPIIAAATKAASELSDKLAEQLLKRVVEGMDGYRAEEVFKTLLGIKSRY